MKRSTEERYPLACELTDTGQARDQVARAVTLHRDGLKLREIAAEMGIAVSTAQDILSDPLREKARARKAKTDGVCLDCGGRTVSCGSPDNVPERCLSCAKTHQHNQARVRLLAALDDWVIRFGEPPTAWDWNLPMAKPRAHPETWARLIAKHQDRKWPVASSVQQVFGSWNNFIREGGHRPRKAGERMFPEVWERHQRERYHKEAA